MLFKFLKYVKTSWYYNISSGKSDDNHYFVDYRSLPEEQQALLDIDSNYHSEDAILCDAAYQILQKGIMNPDARPLKLNPSKSDRYSIGLFANHRITINQDIIVDDVYDNYRFVRRFFNAIHLYYIFFLRLASFHNPIKEIRGLLASKKVKRIKLFDGNGFVLYAKEYDAFRSNLVERNPKVSVIVPTLNRYEYLKDVLSDLEKQDYKNFEVIVVDQTDPFNEPFYHGWNLDLKYQHQEEKALWLARNNAIRMAEGEYILLYDDDSRVDSNWISEHLKCLDYFKCDISSGVSLSVVGARIPEDYSYFKWSAQVDTGNVMFRKDLMKDTGMFDRQFEKQRQGDGEFGLRAYLCGKTNISNPYAKRIHLKVPSGGLRQMGSWDGLRPKKLFAPRPVPSVLYLIRKYFGSGAARIFLIISIPFSLMPYSHKGKKAMTFMSFLKCVILFPIVFIQVAKSWHQASAKLSEGDKIELL